MKNIKHYTLGVLKGFFLILPFIYGIQGSGAMEEVHHNNTVLSFPKEIISQIVDSLDFEDLCLLKMVSLKLNEFAANTQERLWKGYYPCTDDHFWADYNLVWTNYRRLW